jgi:membrane protein DedA with SNARE-associated domain
MITAILSWLASLIISVISASGYLGIAFLMTLESGCILIPSEVIMPFSGYLVSTGRFTLWIVILAGTVGNLAGSVLAYAIGYWGGRPLVIKYGKYILLREEEIDKADKWFARSGPSTVFLSRMLPVVRTFISLPAGIAKMNFPKFLAYTFFGSLPWNFGLAYLGLILGENWKSLETYFRKFDYLILGLLILAVIWWIWKHFNNKNKISNYDTSHR